MNGMLYQFKPAQAFSSTPKVHEVDYQSWTEDNLLVESEHNDILYFTTRWDALCPYIDVNEQMLRSAPRPLLVYALPPESSWGHPIRNAYGMADVRQAGYWSEERRARKFKELGVSAAEEIPSAEPTETSLRSLAAAQGGDGDKV